jgi:predicted DNA-binding transcriptional regulator
LCAGKGELSVKEDRDQGTGTEKARLLPHMRVGILARNIYEQGWFGFEISHTFARKAKSRFFDFPFPFAKLRVRSG